MKTRRSFSCETCGHHVHPTAGTIFEKSTTPLTLWFYAVYLMAQTRAGISAKQLERELGVTYKTAWRMFHQIRKMMADDGGETGNDTEIDEVYMHPNPQRRSTAQAHSSQVIVGIVERKGRAKVRHIKSSGYRSVFPEVFQHVVPGSTVYTDEHQVYMFLDKLGYKHHTIKHSDLEFVKGHIHIQNVENLFSTMKRGIKGVYRHVDAKYLQAYADEYAFRYSHRNSPSMFWAILNQVERAK
jgi:transposase